MSTEGGKTRTSQWVHARKLVPVIRHTSVPEWKWAAYGGDGGAIASYTAFFVKCETRRCHVHVKQYVVIIKTGI
jgi:hypothetical protein